MEDMTQRYPDLATVMPRFLNEGNNSFILDCEAVAWDREAKKILPFQILSSRKRKDVEEGSIKVRICLFAFDILFFNGESLLQKTLAERRQIIKDHFPEVDGEFRYAQSIDAESTDEIQSFLDQSVADNCEGLMIKVLETSESGYEPSKRSRNWLKLKKDYLEGVGDSLDLVVLGGYHGRGRRTNFYGGYLLGCYNPENEEYETVCKIGTGFSDENLEAFYNELSKTVINEPKGYFSFTPSASPDVWFEPTKVWEIKTADLTLSPVYTAGIEKIGGKGISLRFPRFIRVRDDKAPEDSTNSEQIVEMYQSQRSVAQ
jgi:DNA ligase 1